MIYSVSSATVGDMVRVVDAARDKDVVWLSLCMGIIAVIYAAWRDIQREKQADRSSDALIKAAETMKALTLSIEELREEIRERIRGNYK